VCVLAIALPGEAGPRGGLRILTRRGTCAGRIATGLRGEAGFGYDPLFEPAAEEPGGRTLGQWSAAEKNAISHRSKAARRMSPVLRGLGL
jgi:XTP/dITP diphosphohydrolase